MLATRVFAIRRALALAGAVAVLATLWFVVSLFQPFGGGDGHGHVVVRIPAGAGVSQIGSLLARRGVVASGFFFALRVGLAGDRSRLRAGYFVLHRGMGYGPALALLLSEPGLPPSVTLTIIPGRSRRQVQAQLHAAGVRGNYLQATLRSPLLDPASYGAPAHVPTLEGFLWPDTYELRKPVKLAALVADQLERFRQEFATVNFAYARAHDLTPYDVLKIASLVSEEAMLPGDLPRAASVIYNRLRLGMKLGLDSTVAYATGNYGTLTERDLQSRSSFNTFTHTGLPPTPIDSPDLAAIQAAAHPARTDDLYFIDRVCGNGALRFTPSYDQFLVWSRAWDRALALAARNHTSAEFCKGSRP
jgi:UPF0755 protein